MVCWLSGLLGKWLILIFSCLRWRLKFIWQVSQTYCSKLKSPLINLSAYFNVVIEIMSDSEGFITRTDERTQEKVMLTFSSVQLSNNAVTPEEMATENRGLFEVTCYRGACPGQLRDGDHEGCRRLGKCRLGEPRVALASSRCRPGQQTWKYILAFEMLYITNCK